MTFTSEVSRGVAPRVFPVRGRRIATVSLDLRRPGHVGAVAVDRRGRLSGFAMVEAPGDFDPSGRSVLNDSETAVVALIQQALKELGAQPQEVRILLGAQQAQIGSWSGEKSPDTACIAGALGDEGYERVAVPATAVMEVALGIWWVAQCAESRLTALVLKLSELIPAQALFVVDQLHLGGEARDCAAIVEHGKAGLSIIVRRDDGTPLARSLPAVPDFDSAVTEVTRTLETAGRVGRIRFVGSEREALREVFDHRGIESGFEAVVKPLPEQGSQPLPAHLEMAWLLAVAPKVELPVFHGECLARQWRSMVWARRVALAGAAMAFLGLALVTFGWTSHRAARSQGQRLEPEKVRVEAQVEGLRSIAGLVTEVQDLRAQLANSQASWPRLAPTLERLANGGPSNLGWERLTVRDTTLELEVLAFGAAPHSTLSRFRGVLETAPGVVNIAWDAPVEDARGVRQVVRASLRRTSTGAREAAR